MVNRENVVVTVNQKLDINNIQAVTRNGSINIDSCCG